MSKEIFDREKFYPLFKDAIMLATPYIQQELGLSFFEREKFISEQYALNLLYKNQYLNLTAIKSPTEVAFLHFVDSLTFESAIRSLQNEGKLTTHDKLLVADVGTGAGFPGLYTQLLYPKKKVFLLDSLKKRLVYLEELSSLIFSELEKNDNFKKDDFFNKLSSFQESIVCVHGRAEDLGHRADLREQIDVVTARAVANLPSLLEFCVPFVKVGGYFIALKGPKDELSLASYAIKEFNLTLVDTLKFYLPYDGVERNVHIFRKNAPLKNKYPRKHPLVTQKPLI